MTNVSIGIDCFSCQSRITSKRGKMPTLRSSATRFSTLIILLLFSAFSLTRGEYWGSTSTTSLLAAWRL